MIKPNEVFIIEKNKIYTKYECVISIDKKDYHKDSLIEFSDKFSLPGILNFYFPKYDDYSQIVVNYDVYLLKTNNIEMDGYINTITYSPKDLVMTQEYISNETNMGLLDRILNGNVKYVSDPKILINMLHDTLSGIDLVHLELIVSNMFRENDNVNQRCRLKGTYKNPQIIGVKSQPHEDSWKSALAFQFIEKAIQKGLIDGKSIELNPIEKILNEDFEGL